jgi:pimeloyl-ACP methyl ester carboxylesterase
MNNCMPLMSMRRLLMLLFFGAGPVLVSVPSHAAPSPQKATIVLVHGAFADSSSWNGVIRILADRGYPVVAVANPLRGLKSDAEQVSAVLKSIKDPVVLVGHSYGGAVISNTSADSRNVQALVYVGAFAPDAGETAFDLAAKFPGSTLGDALAPPVLLNGGGVDLYIRADRFRDQFASDVPAKYATLMAATQRPITEGALKETSAEPRWKAVPSWFVYGDRDKNIPAAALAFMAERAKSRETVVVPGGSHAVMVARPRDVAKVIERAAQSRP